MDCKGKYHSGLEITACGACLPSRVPSRTTKNAIVELDASDKSDKKARLLQITDKGGKKLVKALKGVKWGSFLRYNYLRFDFSDVQEEGVYMVEYGDVQSNLFSISPDIYKRHVWQPTLEDFLPVQMCHMRVNEAYKVWHGVCHMDDALMAPVDSILFDGYKQGPSTLTHYKSGDHVPGLNTGGWHDAGDDDLRVESQAGTVQLLIPGMGRIPAGIRCNNY